MIIGKPWMDISQGWVMNMLTVSNLSSMIAYRYYSMASAAMSRTLQHLSSGMRINSAADDPAGLAISEGMRSQINAMNQGVRNAQDAISLLETADGALNETHSLLQRMRTLTMQAANDTLDPSDRAKIKTELDQLAGALNDISHYTEFNTQKLLDGSFANKTFFLGNYGVSASIGNMGAGVLGVSSSSLLVMSSGAAQNTLTAIDRAISSVSQQRSYLGAMQNRLEHSVNYMQTMSDNLAASESRIRDADMAQEMMLYVKQQIQTQVALAVMAQANQQSKLILKLFEL